MNKKTKNPLQNKKLKLSTETVRKLDNKQLVKVAGGIGSVIGGTRCR